jgi:hypothetical protein
MQSMTKILLCALLALVGATAASADVRIGIRLGDSYISAGDGGVSARINLGHGSRYGHPHAGYPRYRYRARTVPLFGQPGRLASRIGSRTVYEKVPVQPYPYHRTPLVVGIPVTQRTQPQATQPQPLPPVQPSLPVATAPTGPEETDTALDPAGHARIIRARGTGPTGPEVTVGQALPLGVPHVIIDPRRFGLPQPPSGQIYARVRGRVFQIDPNNRQVTREITPE